MAGILDGIKRNLNAKFDNVKLENHIKQVISKDKLTRGDLEKLTSLAFDSNNEALTQHDLDLLSQYCSFESFSLSNTNLENRNIDKIKAKKISINNSKLKGLILGKISPERLTLTDCNDLDAKQLTNVKPKYLTLSYSTSESDSNSYKKIENLDKLQNIDTIRKLTLEGITNVQDLELNNNVRSLYVNNCNINDLNTLTKFSTVQEIDASNNPFSDISPIVDMQNLRSFNSENTNLSLENLDLLDKLDVERRLFVRTNGTPVHEELEKKIEERKLQKEKEYIENREKNKLTIENPELLQYLKNLLHKENAEYISSVDLEEFANENHSYLVISSDLVNELMDLNFDKKLGIDNLKIDLKKEKEFNVEEFLNKRNRGNGQLSFIVDTPFFNFSDKDIELLKSRYGITYDIYNENYHIDDVLKMQEQISKLIPEFSEETNELEKVHAIYEQLSKNIEFIPDKYILKNMNGIRIKTSSGQIVPLGSFIDMEHQPQELNKLPNILKDKKANDYGMNILLNAALEKTGLNPKLESGIEFVTFPNVDQSVSRNIVYSEIKIDDNFYKVRAPSSGLNIVQIEKQIETLTPKEKTEISAEEVKDFVKDVPQKDVKACLTNLIGEVEKEKQGDNHDEI